MNKELVKARSFTHVRSNITIIVRLQQDVPAVQI